MWPICIRRVSKCGVWSVNNDGCENTNDGLGVVGWENSVVVKVSVIISLMMIVRLHEDMMLP